MPPLPLSAQEQTSIHQYLIAVFPNLNTEPYELWSECTDTYNCIAFAADVGCLKGWWPADPLYAARDYYWPAGLPYIDTVDNFIDAFRTLGYAPCSSRDQEAGFEKVAIYHDPFTGNVLHMAKQLESGVWASKLGDLWDIQHPRLEAVEGTAYGVVIQIMKRLKN